MSGAKRIEKRALSLLSELEAAGKAVRQVAVEGQRIEIVLASGDTLDEFDSVDMRYDKT